MITIRLTIIFNFIDVCRVFCLYDYNILFGCSLPLKEQDSSEQFNVILHNHAANSFYICYGSMLIRKAKLWRQLKTKRIYRVALRKWRTQKNCIKQGLSVKNKNIANLEIKPGLIFFNSKHSLSPKWFRFLKQNT